MAPQQQSLFDESPDPWEMDDADEQLVATIVFAEPPFGPFDYQIPAELCSKLALGCRVEVPLGRGNRPQTGYCIAIESRRVGSRPLKPVQTLIDAVPLLAPHMLQLSSWMADHYLCPLGQVLHSIIPAGVKSQAGTREVTFLKVPQAVIEQLDRGQLDLPPKQLAALKILIASPRPLTPPQLARIAKCTIAPISQLRKAKLITADLRRVQQFELEEVPSLSTAPLILNPDQSAALSKIIAALQLREPKPILMHGVTGSGKTEVYIRAIEEVIQFGRQAIVLVPEISLTPQSRERFRARFGSVAVLHSHQSDGERHYHWQRIARGEVQVIVGARSAIFAPAPQLGLIIIDEEHDGSFKQGESPRYHARDVAIRRAQLEKIPLVLGSATPALESWDAALRGDFDLVSMPSRVSDRPLPDVATIDLRTQAKGQRSPGAISRPLFTAIHLTLQDNGQVILLLNRRGYSTHIQCPACGFVAKCPDCEIALTHHREGEKVLCHYCDYQADAPARCPDCKFDGIRYSGLGTQKLEAEIRARFPGASVLRMDSDTMQRPGSHEAALAKFRAGEVQVLVGTQMIAKGLDFPNVTLVGVINADTALHLPDFRASERTFQLVTQVAGRTGRGDRPGRVLVQTFAPDHPAIQAAIQHDYIRFATQELPIRKLHRYPPTTQLVRIVLRGENQQQLTHFAESLTQQIHAGCKTLGMHLDSGLSSIAPPSHSPSSNSSGSAPQAWLRTLGPAPCPIEKLRGKFRMHLLLTTESFPLLKSVLKEVQENLPSSEEIQWIVDVDPHDML